MAIYEDIQNYQPYNRQEELDKITILQYLDNYPNAF